MSFVKSFFTRRENTASVAKERLQICLTHERIGTRGRDSKLMDELSQEILEVVQRKFSIDADKVKVKMDPKEGSSRLEIDIELPNTSEHITISH